LNMFSFLTFLPSDLLTFLLLAVFICVPTFLAYSAVNGFYLLAIEGRYSEICGKIMTSAIATMSMITKGMLAR
jgi:hypothetical protein